MAVIKKIVPVHRDASAEMWVNDTVEVFRICPVNGTRNGTTELTVIGRNFIQTPLMLCRFTVNDTHTVNVNGTRTKQGTFSVDVPATFESRTRVRCTTPPYTFPIDPADLRNQIGKGMVTVRVANNGAAWSFSHAPFEYLADQHLPHPSTDFAQKQLIDQTAACMAVRYNYSAVIKKADVVTTIPLAYEEGEREDEEGWFMLRGLSTAKVMFDFRHLPVDMRYNEHYKIAAYVHNSST